jgi:choline dehydrogenase-like flavoprotein
VSVFTFSDVSDDRMVDADVAIVGTGAGGAAAAARLAEAGKRVVMLEAGSYFPVGTFPNKTSTSLLELYYEGGQLAASGPTIIPMAAGSGVGGSTLINSAICFRGPAARLDEWADLLDNPRYSAAAMAAKYDEVEATIQVAPTPRDPVIAGMNTIKALEGAEALNYDCGLIDRNAPGCVGCGVCQMGCPVGGKGSVDLNFLALRAFAHDTTVYANCPAEAIVTDNGRAIGVIGRFRDPATRQRGPRLTVRADRIILSAGSIGTAKLLLWTGVSDNDHIGRHLRIHPGGGAFAIFEDDIRIWSGVTQGAYVHFEDDPDILLETFSVGTETLFAQAASCGRAAKDFIANIAKYAGLGALIRDESEGRVSLGDRGLSSISYYLEPHDAAKMLRGLKYCAEVFFAAGAKSVYPAVWFVGWCDSMAELEAKMPDVCPANDILLYGSHLQGTCRMARTPEEGVTDSRGQLFDVPGLYIADASLFPGALGRNPQMTVMSFALNVAEQMLEDW